jgi:hypothetical protein
MLGPFPIGETGELRFEADISRDRPGDVFPELLIHAMRQAGELSDQEEFIDSLELFWREQYLEPRGVSDLRDRWHARQTEATGPTFATIIRGGCASATSSPRCLRARPPTT